MLTTRGPGSLTNTAQDNWLLLMRASDWARARLPPQMTEPRARPRAISPRTVLQRPQRACTVLRERVGKSSHGDLTRAFEVQGSGRHFAGAVYFYLVALGCIYRVFPDTPSHRRHTHTLSLFIH